MRYFEKQPQTTAEYINMVHDGYRGQLTALCNIIRAAAPMATESISYQIPCFKYLYMLVGIGINKKYCSFYVMSPGLVKKMKDELKGLKVSGSTIHFNINEELPGELIRNIVAARMMENEVRKGVG